MNALLFAMLLAPATAFAAPLITSSMVWLHVPDRATEKVDSADRELFTERAQVERMKHELVASRGDREDLRARRRDARAERIVARKDFREARRDLRDSWKSGDDTLISRRTHTMIDRLEGFDMAREHVKWHNALLKVNRAERCTDNARISHAKAELEFAQAVLLHQNGYRFVYGPATFEKQIGRTERRVEARSSQVEVASSVATDVRTEYVASNF